MLSAHTEQTLSSLGQCVPWVCVYVLVEYNNGSLIPEHECVPGRRVCLHILRHGEKKLWLISNSILKEKLFQTHFFITVFVKVELLRRDQGLQNQCAFSMLPHVSFRDVTAGMRHLLFPCSFLGKRAHFC